VCRLARLAHAFPLVIKVFLTSLYPHVDRTGIFDGSHNPPLLIDVVV